MKVKLVPPILLIDCGKASKKTRGWLTGLFTEAGSPPFTRYN